MRIHRLDLTRIRHLVDRSIPLDAARPTVVVGRNEAGKSTFLEGVRRLLYGFPHQAEHLAPDFDADRQKHLAVGARLVFDDERVVYEVTRKKGKKETLAGRAEPIGDLVDEAFLLQRLSLPSELTYHRFFAFSLDELARGAEALQDSAFKAAITGVALGTSAPPAKVRDTWKREAEELFKPSKNATAPRLNALAKEIEAREGAVGAASTRTNEWAERRAAVEAAEKALEKAHAEQARLLAKQDRARALAAGIEASRALAAAEDERAAIPSPCDLSAATKEAYRAAKEGRARAKEALEEAHAEVAAIGAERAAIVVDEAVLGAAAAIDAAYRGHDAYARAVAEGPRLAAQAEASTRKVKEGLAEARAAWSLEELRALRLDVAATHALDASIASLTKLAAAKGALEEEIDEQSRALEEAEARVASLPPANDVAAAKGWLEGWGAFAEGRRRLEELSREAKADDRRRVQRAARLDPAPPSDASERPWPHDAELKSFEDELLALDQRAVRLADARAHVAAARAEVDEALDAIAEGGEAPREADLADARAHRDEGWRLVKRALSGEPDAAAVQAYDDARPLPRAYEHAVLRADGVADAMRRRADAVQRRAHEEARKGKLDREAARLDGEGAALEEAKRAFAAKWGARWEKLGVSPRSPAEMRAWLREVVALVEADEEIEKKRAVCASLEASASSHLAWGRALVGDGDAKAEEVRARLDARVKEEAAREAAASEAKNEVARVRRALEKKRDRRKGLAEEEARAHADFEAAARVLGVQGEPPAAARRVIERLATLRRDLDGADDLRARADRHHEERVAFEGKMEALRAAIGPFPDVATAQERLERARDASARREALARDHARAVRRVEEQERLMRRHEASIAEVHARFGADSDEELARIVERSEKADDLARKIDEHRRELFAARGPFASLEEFRAALVDASPASIEAELADLGRAIAGIGESIVQEAKGLGEAKARLDAIRGGSVAAELSNELESLRATLREEVERWMAIELARVSLGRAIDTFERHHQAPLLGAASALFAKMTAGRYPAIHPKIDGTFEVERDDTRHVRPDQLSTGTREQLFLALRLATVGELARGRESLPIVLDDVLVDFDDQRARATLEALVDFARTTQVVLLTCHEYTRELAKDLPIAFATL